jgi:PAS domain-containing protein
LSRLCDAFELLLDSIPVPFLQLDDKARILRANEKCAEILHDSAARLRGTSLLRLLSRADSRRLRESLTTAGRKTSPSTIRLSIRDGVGGHPVDMRLRRQFSAGGFTFSAVVEPADVLHGGKSAARVTPRRDPQSINELQLELGAAANLHVMGEILGN